jgi:hypothetical protein
MRIRNHIRSNVIGYVALFFAISGTAVALDGENTVFSDDIVNGEVKRSDIDSVAVNGPKIATDAVSNVKLADDAVANAEVADGAIANPELADGAVGPAEVQDGAITSAKVLDDNQAGGGLGPSDLATNSVAQAEVATDGIAATEIQNDSIDTGEIVDFGLSNQDVGVLFAQVNADGTLANSSGGVISARVGGVGAGTYEVDFGRNVTACAFIASLGTATSATQLGEVSAVDRSGNVEAVFVETNTSAGANGDRAFQLAVIC